MTILHKLILGALVLVVLIQGLLLIEPTKHKVNVATTHTLEIDSHCTLWFDGTSGYPSITEGDKITFEARNADPSVQSFEFHFPTSPVHTASPFPNPNPPPLWKDDFAWSNSSSPGITTQPAILTGIEVLGFTFDFDKIIVNGQACPLPPTGVHVQK
jgi:hypothetical protein